MRSTTRLLRTTRSSWGLNPTSFRKEKVKNMIRRNTEGLKLIKMGIAYW